MTDQSVHTPSVLGVTYRRLLETSDIAARVLFVVVILLVFLQRAILFDVQLDWDEEWYFQIARAWKRGLVPYRDIFDHKPPMVYVFYMLTSWGTHLFMTRLVVTCLLIGSVILMFRAVRRAGYITDRQVLLLVPALCCLMSQPFWIASSNTEMIYGPLVFLSFGLLLEKHLYVSAVCAALAIAIKYTAVADILGITVLYWFVSHNHTGRKAILWVWGVRVLGLSAALYLAFYIYFRLKGIDLVEQIVTLNLKHPASSSAPLFGPLSGIRWFLIDVAEVSALVAAGCVLRKPNTQLLKGAIPWLVLSTAQACLTRRYYIHYFIPALAPLTLIGASFRLREAMVPVLLLFLAALQCGRICESYHSRTEYQNTAAQYRGICGVIGNRGYITTYFLAGYRVCDAPSLDKFAFPPFYLQDYFVAVSGSGGLMTLKSKLKTGEIVSLISFQSQSKEFQSSLGIGEDRIHVMPGHE